MQSDIRKWFMKTHNEGNNNGNPPKPALEIAGKRPTANDKQKEEDVTEVYGVAAKRKVQKSLADVKPPPLKKPHIINDDDFVPFKIGKSSVESTPSKKLKSGSAKGVPRATVKESDDDEDAKEVKSGGRGRGGKGGSSAAGGGRGRFIRKDPPHKGEKEVPEGSSDCLAGLTFVISGTLDSLEREDAEDLIKRYGGRVTGSISKKTNYLLCGEDIGVKKSEKAKDLGTHFLTEDGLFDMIRASNRSKVTTKEDNKKHVDKIHTTQPKASPQKGVNKTHESTVKGKATTHAGPGVSSAKRKKQTVGSSLLWTEKYKPKVPNDIIGNQKLVKKIHVWLTNWNDNVLNAANKGKGEKQSEPEAKKAILLSGPPGTGKTTSAKLVSQMLGFQTIEVNASDSRGKADAKIDKGISSSTANSVKELVSNQSLSVDMNHSKHPKAVLIMDEVDGMSAGDRGGVADLISSIKISKIPIICICNDRYSQKLKSLVNYCSVYKFDKLTKQQMAKRLAQVASSEGIQVNEVHVLLRYYVICMFFKIALEELAERVNGDMRMALNQLQYISLSMSSIKFDDIRQRLLSSSKDEAISPIKAVNKLFGNNAGNLRMDERFDLSMSDPDLVPLIIQENYINYNPSAVEQDGNGVKRMNLLVRAADSIVSGDIMNVQIRRYRQWQLSQSSSLTSAVIPAALLRGKREILEQGEKNRTRFAGWLGKNSTMRKNNRLIEDVHLHLQSSLRFNLGRSTVCLDYLSLLLKHMTNPLKSLPKNEAVEKVVEFMDAYSINRDDFDSLVLMSTFKGLPDPLDGVQSAVKSALTKAYKIGSKSRVIRTADMITLPGIKKASKKRVAAMLEPVDDGPGEVGDAIADYEENNSDAEDLEEGIDEGEEKPKVDINSLSFKGIQIQTKSKATGSKRASASRGSGGASSSKRKR